jgi:hypothetical protein
MLACGDGKYSQEEEKLKKVLKYYSASNDLIKRVYLVSLTDGCSGCVHITNEFIKENIAHPNIQYIITSDSRKEIKFKLGNAVAENSKVILDLEKIAYKQNLVFGYPTVLFCKDGSVIRSESITVINAKEILKSILDFASE